ncbi:hypothetical protein HD597_007027 [Nonomuraea thailandensis]|uniref:Uncharacterized protein n=1 Tax=Nonomuraea thailandensis TaxID=1188745 RepID=A0A9X2K403_9ACTN|nr:hypothetical protein [Nonomuraea thailandensis]MCP2360007.1 hypothetical protein [Nonomuraea thailandensis]
MITVPFDGRVRLERCAAGRLRDAYPVAAHDLEVQAPEADAGLLRAVVDAVAQADPHCRRVVYAVPEGDLNRMAVAESAGFRYVVDVDLADAQLSLLVAEPEWVTRTDMDLDHVPGS